MVAINDKRAYAPNSMGPTFREYSVDMLTHLRVLQANLKGIVYKIKNTQARESL